MSFIFCAVQFAYKKRENRSFKRCSWRRPRLSDGTPDNNNCLQMCNAPYLHCTGFTFYKSESEASCLFYDSKECEFGPPETNIKAAYLTQGKLLK